LTYKNPFLIGTSIYKHNVNDTSTSKDRIQELSDAKQKHQSQIASGTV